MLPAWALRGHPLKSEILKNLSKTLVDQEFADNLGPNSFGLTQNSFFRDSYCKIVTFYPGILSHQAQKAANSQTILPDEK